MSDDKQLSGIVDDSTHEDSCRDPNCPKRYTIQAPRPASPAPEQPAQGDLTEARELMAEIRRALLREDDGREKGIADLPESLRRASTIARLSKAITALAEAALAPPAQTQQGLSETEVGAELRGWLVGREAAKAACENMTVESVEEMTGATKCYEAIRALAPPAPLNPDKQPSPSVAPAQTRRLPSCAGPLGKCPAHGLAEPCPVCLENQAAPPAQTQRDVIARWEALHEGHSIDCEEQHHTAGADARCVCGKAGRR